MHFKPFGKSFQIDTRLTLEDVREAIYERQRNRFEPGSGPSSLVVGSLILLWMPSYGLGAQPQLICRVTASAQGSRIRGVMGFGILFAWTLAALFGGAAIFALLMGHITGMSALGAAFFPLLLFAFNDTKSAEPLLRYLRNSLDLHAGALSVSASNAAFTDDLTLEVSDTPHRHPITPQTILDALLHLQEDGDATLFLFRRGAGSLQATPDGTHFTLERRIEGEAGYQRAFRRGGATEASDRLSRHEALAAYLAFAAGAPLPETIGWRQVAPRRA